MQKPIALLRVQVRRDAHTTTPETVLAHELAILYEIHGKENVTVDEAAGDARQVDADGEYQRLADKYGLAIVEEVYGRESSGRLADALARTVDEGVEDDDEAAPVARRRGRRSTQPVQPEPTEDEAVQIE